MIQYQDIASFFDYEAEAEAQSWKALMKLPIKERIHKRKAKNEKLLYILLPQAIWII